MGTTAMLGEGRTNLFPCPRFPWRRRRRRLGAWRSGGRPSGAKPWKPSRRRRRGRGG
ncbi:unnamed protein product [Spirodela intermedia]|uniref:Uncharacterized protein n=1 Tax=Spirodela intermedia TaxID=51605 RepID=A0ABN7EE39_SPIIN|nr:unnamed protein product [Spirodela intermedia]